jgi:F-box associated protein
MVNLDTLPRELQRHILSYTSREDKKNLRLVNKSIYPIATRELVHSDRVELRKRNDHNQDTYLEMVRSLFAPSSFIQGLRQFYREHPELALRRQTLQVQQQQQIILTYTTLQAIIGHAVLLARSRRP